VAAHYLNQCARTTWLAYGDRYAIIGLARPMNRFAYSRRLTLSLTVEVGFVARRAPKDKLFKRALDEERERLRVFLTSQHQH
jgi:hypothetical protein